MKKWNKATAVALLTAFVMTGALPAHAEKPATPVKTTEQEAAKPAVPADMIQEKQAIAKARELMGGLAEFKFEQAFFAESNEYISRGLIWSVTFSTVNFNDPDAAQFMGKKGPIGNVRVILDAKSGELLQFNIQNPKWTGDNFLTETEALKAADDFLLKTASALVPNLMEGEVTSNNTTGGFLDETGKERNYRSTDVKYYEMVNGIPFYNNVVHVSVDEYGHVVHYFKQFLFDSSKLPKPENAISQEKATDAFAKGLEMNLYYQAQTSVQNDQGDFELTDTPGLIYSLDEAPAIDAFTGKPLENNASNGQIKRDVYKVQGESKQLIAKDKAAAVKLVTELMEVDLSKLEFEQERFTAYGDSSETISYVWHERYDPSQATDQRYPVYVTMNVDSATGRVQQLYRAGLSSNERAFTVNDGMARVLDIIKSYAPQGEQELMLTATYDYQQMDAAPEWFDQTNTLLRKRAPEGRYSYQLNVMHQGVPILDRYYTVDLDPQSGKLISLTVPEGKAVQLPDSSKAVKQDVVEQKFIKNHPVQMFYIWDEYQRQQAPQGQLIYAPNWLETNFSHTDALTGTEVHFNNR